MPSFSATSKRRLLTCDDRLQRLFYEVITEYDCAIVCGFRNQADQEKAFAAGFSKVQWPNGKHNRLPSMAVDVLPGPGFDYKDEDAFRAFAKHVFGVWACLGDDTCKLVWGGNWNGFVDFPHWELESNEFKKADGRTRDPLISLCGPVSLGLVKG